jgi:hypothetical protein
VHQKAITICSRLSYQIGWAEKPSENIFLPFIFDEYERVKIEDIIFKKIQSKFMRFKKAAKFFLDTSHNKNFYWRRKKNLRKFASVNNNELFGEVTK